jgi:hypothetical protein
VMGSWPGRRWLGQRFGGELGELAGGRQGQAFGVAASPLALIAIAADALAVVGPWSVWELSSGYPSTLGPSTIQRVPSSDRRG